MSNTSFGVELLMVKVKVKVSQVADEAQYNALRLITVRRRQKKRIIDVTYYTKLMLEFLRCRRETIVLCRHADVAVLTMLHYWSVFH